MVIWVVVGLAMSAYAQSAPQIDDPPLSVKCEIVGVRLEPNEGSHDYFRIVVSVNAHIVNLGGTPVLIATRALPWFSREVVTSGSGSLDNEKVLYEEAGVSNGQMDYEWLNLKSHLRGFPPPPDAVRSLAPGEGWTVSYETPISIQFDPLLAKSSEANAAHRDALTSNAPVYYRVQVAFWPPAAGPLKGLAKFGHRLQKRWERYGRLKLDSVWSEPVQLNLPARGTGSG
jgi:hypothetical protein